MSEPINALAVSGLSSAAITLAPGADAHRAHLLKISQAITEVDEFTLDAASDALKLLQETARAVEKQRTEIKAPVLKLGKDIDGVAKAFTGPIEAEATRLGRLIGTYQAEQQRIAREAEEARQRAIREAQAKAEAEARAAAAKAQAEADDFLPPSPPPAPSFPAPLPPPVAAPAKIAGVQMRTVWKYEVTDILALYKARPDLVNLEPNGRAILAALPADLPGVKAWQETTATSRT